MSLNSKRVYYYIDRGERIIRYLNNIRILFVFVHTLKPEYCLYSYSSKTFGPNIICIRIRPKYNIDEFKKMFFWDERENFCLVY